MPAKISSFQDESHAVRVAVDGHQRLLFYFNVAPMTIQSGTMLDLVKCYETSQDVLIFEANLSKIDFIFPTVNIF